MDMDVNAAASALGISKDAVRKAIKRGIIEARVVPPPPRERPVGHGSPPGSGGMLGGVYIIDSDEVERYRTARQRQPQGSSK